MLTILNRERMRYVFDLIIDDLYKAECTADQLENFKDIIEYFHKFAKMEKIDTKVFFQPEYFFTKIETINRHFLY